MKDIVLSSIEELSTDWLSRVLMTEVVSFTHEKIVGEGYNSRLYRINLEGLSSELPASLILKLASDNEAINALLTPTALYREVKSYSLLKDKIGELLPGIYLAEIDKEKEQVTLLMEDLGEIPHKPFCENLENSIKAIRAIAEVHAAYWRPGNKITDVLFPLVDSYPQEEILKQLRAGIIKNRARDQPHEYLNRCVEHMIKLLPYLVETSDSDKGPGTIIHGDFHCRNLHFIGDRLAIFDWQQCQYAQPATDLAYWLLMSVDVGNRDEFEPILMDAYHDQLVRCGVTDYSRKQLTKESKMVEVGLIGQIFVAQNVLEQTTPEQISEIDDLVDRISHAAIKQNLIWGLRLARVILPLVGLFKKEPDTVTTTNTDRQT